MKKAPKLFGGEEYEAYKKRILEDGYASSEEEADLMHTEAWYTRRANYRHEQAERVIQNGIPLLHQE